MIAFDIFQPPVWVGVVIAIVTYVCLGTVVVFAWIAWGARRLERRRVARAARGPEMARVQWERDAAANTRPHGGVEPGIFALDRATRRGSRA